MNKVQVMITLARVLTTGTIMSIEKNEQELLGLQRLIKKQTQFGYVCLVNSYSAALHTALWGLSILNGGEANLLGLNKKEKKLLRWLNICNRKDSSAIESFCRFNITDGTSLSQIKTLPHIKTVVVDFTELGFGPCAAVLTQDELTWKRCERLKIFGAFDLRTMWTQKEDEIEIQPGVQFNYRLSPLVASCVKMHLLRNNHD